MTGLLTGIIDWFINFCSAHIPAYNFDAATYDTMSASITAVVNFLVDINCFVPLGDVVTIITLTIGLRLFKFTLFFGNWIVRRVCDLLP